MLFRVPINPINILVCIIYAQKIKRTQFFAKVHPWVWQAIPKNLCDHHGMPFTLQLLSLVSSCLYKIVYSILFSLKHWGNLKVIQINWGDDTQVKKCKTKSWKTNTTIWTSSKRRLTVPLSSHTTISGPQTQKLTSQNRHCFFLDFYKP